MRHLQQSHKSLPVLACVVILALSACSGAPTKSKPNKVPTFAPASGNKVSPAEGKRVTRENAHQARMAWKDKSFEEFEASVYKEPFPGGKYIVNGDTPIANEKLLREFFEQEIQQGEQPASLQSPRSLIVNTQNGSDTIWSASKKLHLDYCVSRSFGNHYDAVVADMKAAGEAWSQVADVKFVHLSAHDDNCTATNQSVVFDVRPVNVNGQYLARAFFPNDARSARNVLIDDSSFTLDPNGNLTLRGILRHELGHTLGFRHEHTRPDSGQCFEDNNWRPLTDYDSFSVMHYPQCNGAGDWSLTLTYLDKNGAACIYGPAPGFQVDANICPDLAPQPEPEPQSQVCEMRTDAYAQQQVNQNQEKEYGPYSVKPGSRFTALIFANDSTGDPDLYVRFQSKPTTSTYACRPYLTGANESCSLDVPTGQNKAYVMVRGYKASKYHLVVTSQP
ncbi:matrixin family metalloprotease [Methylomarinum vadi]|uniref:matrixin family metalloprotease n=1 Tax=Methylomarinum vadi TaxID=438855 RepID=UPI00068E9CE1|nr:matrixin family metalloprotease [Methylomarinum vadi]